MSRIMISHSMPLRALVQAAFVPKFPAVLPRPASIQVQTGHLSSKKAFSAILARRTLSAVLLLSMPALILSMSSTAGSARTCSATTSASSLVENVKTQNEKNTVIVYSKSYCPYCASVKGLFRDLKVDFKLIELDELEDGQDVQDALYEVTGRRTVPQVFVNGAFIGGADDTKAKYGSGELQKLFSEAGVSASF